MMGSADGKVHIPSPRWRGLCFFCDYINFGSLRSKAKSVRQ